MRRSLAASPADAGTSSPAGHRLDDLGAVVNRSTVGAVMFKSAWLRAGGVVAVAVVAIWVLLAFQYFVVFLGLIGFQPDQPFPITSSQRVDCFRSIVFLGPRFRCPEGFPSRSAFGSAAAANFVGCLVAASLPVLVAGGRNWRQRSDEKLIALSASALTALPFLAWALVSSFGFLIGSASAN